MELAEDREELSTIAAVDDDCRIGVPPLIVPIWPWGAEVVPH
jgi:hypothetical protein